MRLTKAAKVRVAIIEEKVADAKKELNKAKIRASKVEGEFLEQKEHANTFSKNIIHLTIKLGEMGHHMALMHRKVEDACHGEAQAISNAKAEVAELEKSLQAEIKDLKVRGKNLI